MALLRESQHLNIPFCDRQAATQNFTTLVGKGGFGSVYKGQLSLSGEHTLVAVKRLDLKLSGQGLKEFLTEIHLLSTYKHPNLVSLLGFCDEGNEKILVYEYIERGSLDNYVTSNTLTWTQRLNICLDAARGLDFLHHGVAEHHRVIHRDIKSANVLLDCNWKAKIADLGLSKIGLANEKHTFLVTDACGTVGYCDPVYIDTGILTKESDVYSFGVVLFEVLCSRLCYMNVNDERRFLPSLARIYYENKRLDEIINPDLREQMSLESLKVFSTIAYQCLHKVREERPSMELVVKKLEEAVKYQDGPIVDTLTEVSSIFTDRQMTFCDFSSDGKLLMTCDYINDPVLWDIDSLKPKATLQGHSGRIVHARFSPRMPWIAASSSCAGICIICVWDVDNPENPFRTFASLTHVVCLEFHPNKDDIIRTFDLKKEMRYWSIENGSCVSVFKVKIGGWYKTMRFQPRHGRYLTMVVGDALSIVDVETQACLRSLLGHASLISSVCWDPKGEYLAVVSHDLVRIWSFMPGNEGKCVHKSRINDNHNMTCIFHPSNASLLVIGDYKDFKLWNILEKKMTTIPNPHEGMEIMAFAASNVTGLIASIGDDKFIRLWK